MTPEYDPLDEPTSDFPVSPARRRFSIAFGIVLLILILGVLTWFGVTNTGTEENRGSLYGLASTAESRLPV